MKIASVEAFPVRLPRDTDDVRGTAGSPTTLAPSDHDYRWSETFPALYSVNFETALVKLTTDNGLVGWGEAQAPLAPEVACTIVEKLLRPILAGHEFAGEIAEIEEFWQKMYSAMRVRGQTGGFMVDAISGVDLALWDLAGKLVGKPTAALIADDDYRPNLPAYLSGLSGVDNAARVEQATRYWAQGFRTFKLFFDRTEADLFDLIDGLQSRFGNEIRIAVDALWRLDEGDCRVFTDRLDDRSVLWLEAPLPPEDPEAHSRLAERIKTPIALGESYRTRYELLPFLKRDVIAYLQPDLGRCGITEALRWSRDSAVPIVPHVSIAMGPQIAAALHLAAAIENCPLVEFNPKVFEVANRHLEEPLRIEGAEYVLPASPGLGTTVHLPT